MSSNPIYKRLLNSSRWTVLRADHLADNPLCELCKEQGRTTPAVHVHHKIPVESGVTEARMTQLAFDPNNLMSLCADCHRLIHLSHPARRVHTEQAEALKDFSKVFLGGRMRKRYKK